MSGRRFVPGLLGALLGLLLGPAAALAQTDLTIHQFFLPGTNTSGYRVHASSSHMAVTVQGGPHYRMTYSFAHVATAGLSGLQISLPGTGTTYSPTPFNAWIVAIGIASNEALTAGRATAQPTKREWNDRVSVFTLSVSIGPGLPSSRFNTATQAKGLAYISYQDAIGCRLTTTGTIAPTQSTLLCTVVVES